MFLTFCTNGKEESSNVSVRSVGRVVRRVPVGRNIAILLLVAACCALGFAATGFAGGVTKTDGAEPTYHIELSSGCVVLVRLHHHQRSLELRRRSTLQCEPSVEAEMAAIDQLLAAIESDGVKVADLLSGRLGEVGHGSWKERVADCFVGKHGPDISLVVSNTEVLQVLKNCDALDDLEHVFAKHGASIAVSSIEKVERINLRRQADVHWAKAAGMSEAWIAAHRNTRGAVPIWAMIYFAISPQ
jgi:hypothetical protein